MQRLNWQITNRTFIRGVCTAALTTPFVAASVAIAGSGAKDSSGALPHEAHTVQESVNDAGALPTTPTKTKFDSASGTGNHLGIAPQQVMVDLMTPWNMGYAQSLHNARQKTSSPWGHWWWVSPQNNAFGR